MVRISQWKRYLEEQKIKEKIRLEKEAAEKRTKEAREKYTQQIKLEKKLADALDVKLARTEKRKIERRQHKILRLPDIYPIPEDISEDILEKRPKKRPKKIPEKRPKKRPEFIFTEEDKAKCRKKTLDQLVDEISGSKLVCPPGKEPKKDIDKDELTADIKCFRKRVRKKSPEEIVALYDKLLEDDPERLCKKT